MGEIKKLTDFPINTESPFMKQCSDIILKRCHYRTHSVSKNEDVYINADGDVANVMFAKKELVDDRNFIKLFTEQIGWMLRLSNAGVRVFGYLMTALKPKNDRVIFVLKECQEFAGYSSKAPIYKGLAELLSVGAIARGETDFFYYINPMFFFNGDSASFVKVYQKKSTYNPAKQQQLELPFSE